MRLHVSKSANAECFYIVESIRKDGKNTSRVVERLGNLEEVRIRAGGADPYDPFDAKSMKNTAEFFRQQLKLK